MTHSTELPRLSRLTSILTYLQSRPLVTSTELARRYVVSKRTIYRDIKSLIDSGIPIYTDEGKGYRLMDGYSLPPIMFTEEEASALITAEKIIEQNKDKSLVAAHNKAIEKIRAVLNYRHPDKTGLLSDRIGNLTNYRGLTTSDNLLDIQSAILKKLCLDLTYRSISKSESTERMVEPLAIYYSQDNWILIAWCRLRNDTREFRLDRIEHIRTSNQSFPHRAFDLMKYFMRQS